MRIGLEIDLSEKVEPHNGVESRRFFRVVEMELPEIGHEFELNVSAEPIIVTVVHVGFAADDGLYHVKIASPSLTFSSLREDERWNEQLLQA